MTKYYDNYINNLPKSERRAYRQEMSKAALLEVKPITESVSDRKRWFHSKHALGIKGFQFHRTPSQKSYTNPMEPREVFLAKNLPRSWERYCHVDMDMKSYDDVLDMVKGIPKGFRAGARVTLTDATFYPGFGVLYGFVEGKRMGYGLRQDQIDIPVTEDKPTIIIEEPKEEIGGENV